MKRIASSAFFALSIAAALLTGCVGDGEGDGAQRSPDDVSTVLSQLNTPAYALRIGRLIGTQLEVQDRDINLAVKPYTVAPWSPRTAPRARRGSCSPRRGPRCRSPPRGT
jgi:hypothetical protein